MCACYCQNGDSIVQRARAVLELCGCGAPNRTLLALNARMVSKARNKYADALVLTFCCRLIKRSSVKCVEVHPVGQTYVGAHTC